MISVNTNITSLVVQNHFTLANNCIQTSLERLSTGFKINRAADDAANLSVSKNMECQISGSKVALDNAQQAINLVQTADSAMGEMQDIAQRIRELALQSANGTYSDQERAMIQQEVSSLVDEIYKQRNNAKFNEIFIFGEQELPPHANGAEVVNAESPVATVPVGVNEEPTVSAGYQPVTPLTEDEAVAQGYTVIKSEADFANIKSGLNKKYCLMCDIDFSKISGWGDVTTQSGFELNGNGYAIKNFVINSETNSTMHGLFKDIKSGATVKNLNMENVSIESTQNCIGALCGGAGYNTKGTIDNCTMSGSVTGKDSTGGLVGASYGSITNSSASGSVTGNNQTGGLVGWQSSGSITNSSAAGSVTGNSNTGGLVGSAGGSITNSSAFADVTGTSNTGGLVGGAGGGSTITQSYATGDVEGTTLVGGLVGYNYATISNSYSLGDVTGTGDYVGGAVGQNKKTIEKCYSTGNVTGTGTHVGGFAGDAAASASSNKITNCYTTNQELDFYGANTKGSTVSNCHGATDQTGVTGHEPEWFQNGDNLKSVLGSAFDTSVIPPQIIGNERPVPPPPSEEGIQFQIGANSGEENTLKIDTSFSLNGFDADVTTREKANETIDKVDVLIKEFSIRRSGYGAVQNRLESVMDSLTTKTNNLSASHSTIVDTDFAAESANLVKAQILQNATAALLAQANSAPSIALRLLE